MSTVEEMRWHEVMGGEDDLPTSPSDLSRPASDTPPWDERRKQIVRLAGRFVDQLIRDAIDTRRRLDPSAPVPVVDWDALWAIGATSASVDQAVGRVVVAAEGLAREIAGGRIASRFPGPRFGRLPTSRGPEAGPPGSSVALPPRAGSQVGALVAPSGQGPVLGSPTLRVAVPLPPFVLPRTVAEVAPPEMASTRGSRGALRRERLATAFAWVRNAGVALILFAAWQLWGTSLAQHQAQQSLKQQFSAHVHQAPAMPTTSPGASLVAADTRLAEPAGGSVVAHLQIPAIGVDQYVVEGTAEKDLQMGPGHYIGTAMPGQAGNVAIAGHRTTYGAPFNNLDSMVPGDAIVLTTDSGMALDYIVTQAPVAVPPSDVKILNSFDDNRLTLTTCNPRYSATQRLVVVALLRTPAESTGATAPGGAARQGSKPRLVSTGGAVGWNMSYLPPVLGVLLFIVLLGLVNRRASAYYGRLGRWLILVPIWVAAAYLLFGLLSSFVPSTL